MSDTKYVFTGVVIIFNFNYTVAYFITKLIQGSQRKLRVIWDQQNHVTPYHFCYCHAMSSSKQMYDATMLCDDFFLKITWYPVYTEIQCLFIHVSLKELRIIQSLITVSLCTRIQFNHKTVSLNHFFSNKNPHECTKLINFFNCT